MPNCEERARRDSNPQPPEPKFGALPLSYDLTSAISACVGPLPMPAPAHTGMHGCCTALTGAVVAYRMTQAGMQESEHCMLMPAELIRTIHASKT